MAKPESQKKVYKIPKSILYTGQTLALISSKLATDFAFKLFVTPFKFERPKREQRMYDRSEKQRLYIKSIKKEIQLYHCGKKGNPKILLVHGWAGRGTQLHAIAELFAQHGFHAISFDAPAHGESTGKKTAMIEFISTILEIEKQMGTFTFAIGHSLGGMALINAVKFGFDVKKVAIIGSGDSIIDICNSFVSNLGMKAEIGGKLKKKLDKILGSDVEEYATNKAACFVEIPVLVAHDLSDDEVPVKCAYSISESLKRHELLITENLGHRKILWDKSVLERLMLFFN